MRRVTWLLVIAVLPTIMAAQASNSRIDLGVGYSFAQMHVPNTPNAASMSGVQFDATYNLNRWVGITGEFTGHYKCLSGCVWDASTSRQKAFTFVAGPRIELARSGRVMPWIHVLGGVSNVSYSNDFGQDLATTGGAFVAGGGLDFRTGMVTVRAVQVDVLNHKVGAERQNDLRVGVGVVVGFGERPR